MRKIVSALILLLGLSPGVVLAQSTCPSIAAGTVLTAAQWNACFSTKQNTLGYTPVNRAGDFMTGKLITLGPTTLAAGLNLPHGTAPVTPSNGDLWTTTSGLFAQVNGSTVGPFASTGSIPVTSVFGRTGAVVATTNDYSFAQISGTVGATQLPNPSATTLGGVKSLAAVANQFLTSIGTNGTPTQAQPSAANLSNGTTGSGSVVLATSPTITTPTISSIVNTGTLTLPTSSDTLVGRATTDTLTNKTLTSPTINDPLIGGFIARPQGRLTLTSGTPVLNANAVAQTIVYYTPYQGNLVPIYDGTRFVNRAFSEITAALATSGTNFQTSGSLYDFFVINDTGTLRLCNGPAWSSTSTRGTGAGTTELQALNGIWTNKNSIAACRWGSVSGNTVAVSANQGTYVGTMYATANGQTGMNFTPASASGGANPFLALYNGYNRVRVTSFSQDSTASWTYATATWRPANNSSSNRISWVDGLQQSFADANYTVMATASGGATAAVSIAFNGTTAPDSFATSANMNSTSTLNMLSRGNSKPLLGLSFAQAIEFSTGATSTFSGQGNMGLFLSLEM